GQSQAGDVPARLHIGGVWGSRSQPPAGTLLGPCQSCRAPERVRRSEALRGSDHAGLPSRPRPARADRAGVQHLRPAHARRRWKSPAQFHEPGCPRTTPGCAGRTSVGRAGSWAGLPPFHAGKACEAWCRTSEKRCKRRSVFAHALRREEEVPVELESAQGVDDASVSAFSAVLAREEFREELDRLSFSRWRWGARQDLRLRSLKCHEHDRCTFEIALKTPNGWHSVIGKVFVQDRV